MTLNHRSTFRSVRTRAQLWLLASVAVMLSCELPTARHDDPVVQIIVVPESLSLDAWQQMIFAAYGRAANGDSARVSVSWSASGVPSVQTACSPPLRPLGLQVSATNATLNLAGAAAYPTA